MEDYSLQKKEGTVISLTSLSFPEKRAEIVSHFQYIACTLEIAQCAKNVEKLGKRTAMQ